jgi:16S rRNA processing protein RimM
MHKEYGLLKLREVKDRTEAETMRGLFAMVHLEDAVPLEDDEIYTYELIGLTVITEDKKQLGKITSVMETGANDVYIIKDGPYGEILFPVTDDTVLEINTDEEYVLVRPPAGLIPNL